MKILIGSAKMPGTCGELVQGTLEGVPFHVTCPIELYSEAEVRLQVEFPFTSGGGSTIRPAMQIIFPTGFVKAGEAARRTLEVLGRPRLGGTLNLSSPLPRSKGMASSTADIAATAFAVARALAMPIETKEIADIALSIEPTDGSIFPGIALFDHRSGKLCQSLGSPPLIDVVVLDFGGEVDTVAFNQQDRSALLQKLEPQAREALILVQAGVAFGDPVLVGRGATMSSRSNQEILPKPQLETVISVAREVGAVGVNVGHSGTVIGVLLERRKGDSEAAHDFLRRRLPGLEYSRVCRMVGGGPPDGLVEEALLSV